MMRKLLVVNSNTSKAATERIVAGCAPHVSGDTQLTVVNTDAGPEGIDSLLDVAISGLETVRTIAANRDAYDAFIVACGMDPGLDVARQVTDKPVVGIAEAAMLMACTLGAKFSVLISMRSETAAMEELVRHYGLSSRLASVVAVEMTTAELIGGDRLQERLISAAHRAIDEDMAEVVVLTGSVMGGLEQVVTRQTGVPALSGMVCAIKLAENLVDLGVRTSHIYKYRTFDKLDRLVGYDDLQHVYSASKIVG
jgi:allantoin racemase